MSIGRLVSVKRNGNDLCLEIARSVRGQVYYCQFQNVDRISRLEMWLGSVPNLAPIKSLFSLDAVQLPISGRIGFQLCMESGMSIDVYCEAILFRNAKKWQGKDQKSSRYKEKEALRLQRIQATHMVERALEKITRRGASDGHDQVQFTKLTQPHLCDQCKRPLNDEIYQHLSIGKRSSTLTCHSCKERTSVYAILHNCVRCSVLLESPTHVSGTNVTCPECQKRVAVPRSELLHETDSSMFDSNASFAIHCESCQSKWVAEFESVGESAVCPKCRNVFEVPNHGELLEAICGSTGDDLEAQESAAHRGCRECQIKIPIGSMRCPYCQVDDPIVVDVP